MSRGIHTEWDSNPRPADYESRVRTTTLQCNCMSRMVTKVGGKKRNIVLSGGNTLSVSNTYGVGVHVP